MKSYIKSKKAIKFGKLLTIRRLTASDESVRNYMKNLKKQYPDITEEDLHREIATLVKKDNFYNALMDEVSSAYEFELDEDEVNERVEILQANHQDASKEGLRGMVEISIYKRLIYDDLAKEWEISITDDDVKGTLENFYKSTGNPIREYLTNPAKFEEVRETLREQLISDRLMNAFAVEYRLEEEKKQ